MYGTIVNPGATIAADVYDEATAVVTAPAGQGPTNAMPFVVPVGVGAAGGWTAVGAADIAQAIDDGLAYSEADYAQAAVGFFASPMTAEVGLGSKFTAGGSAMWAGKRIASVGITGFVAAATSGGTFQCGVKIGGLFYNGGALALGAGTAGQVIPEFRWTKNPNTGKPWTAPDLEAFTIAAGGSSRVWIKYSPASYFGGTGRWYALLVNVYWAPETRLGTGYLTLTGSGAAAQTIDLSSPESYNLLHANASNWETAADPQPWVGQSGVSALLAGAFGAGTFVSGSRSLRVTASGGDAIVAAGIGAEAPVVTPGRTVVGRARIKNAGVSRNVNLAIQWYDANDVLLFESTPGANVNEGGAFATPTVTAVAPMDARRALLVARIIGAAAAEIHYIDEAELSFDALAPAFVTGGAVRTFLRKTSTMRLLATLRRIGTVGSFRVPGPTSGEPCPHLVNAYRPTARVIQGSGDTGALAALGPVRNEAPPVLLMTTGAAASVDSQPYASGASIDVYTGSTLTQRITPGFAVNMAVVSFGVEFVGASTAVPDLQITVRRVSGGLNSGTALVAASTIAALGPGIHRRTVTLSPGYLTAVGVQFLIEFATTAAFGNWRIVGETTLIPGIGQQANLVTFGGVTDYAAAAGLGGNRYDYDLSALLTIQPAALTGAAGTLTGSPIQKARFTWNALVGPVNFSRYEVERDDGDGLGYQLVATITTQATNFYETAEAPLGVPVLYRVRWVRGDGAESPWTTPVSITRTAASGCRYEFVRDGVDESLWVTANSVNNPRVVEFDETLVVNNLYDSDDRYARRGTERRGPQFNLDLLLYSSCSPPDDPGFAAFDTLRTLVETVTDYVVVNDGLGGRYYAQVAVPEGQIEEPGGQYVAPVRVSTLTRTPIPV